METNKSNLKIAKYLSNLAKRAYKICSKQALVIKDKGSHDLLTTMDTSIEKFMINDFKKSFPNIKVVSEEFNTKIDATGTYLVIDPIDGTINFANGLDFMFGVQCAFVKDNVCLASAIYSPKLGSFYAAKGFGSFKNNKRFFTKELDPLHSLISFEIKDIDFFTNLYKELNKKVLKPRALGACALSSILVAEGKLGGWICFDCFPWDLLPGFLIMDEAGCKRDLVCSTHIIATSEETLKVLKNAVKKHAPEKLKENKIKAKATIPIK